jgi:hypothetical protein
MKAILPLLLLILGGVRAGAQGQELQQLKLDLEKLAQFKLILSQMKQGYQVLQNGYNSVRDAAKGNFDLHKNYLDGLLRVSESVRRSPALLRLMDHHSTLETEYWQWMSQVMPLHLLTAAELKEIQSAYEATTDQVQDDKDVLSIILQPQVLSMSDAERLAAIEQLAAHSETQLSSVRQLIREKTALLAIRARTKRDIEAVKKLYEAK